MISNTSTTPSLAEAHRSGLLLCTKFLGFGLRAQSVRHANPAIVDRIQAQWRCLDSLSERLVSKDSVHNDNTVRLALAIESETIRVFNIADKSLPSKVFDPIGYQPFMKQRLKLMHRKLEMSDLLKRLNFLYCVTQLLVTILKIAEEIQFSGALVNDTSGDKVVFETLRLYDVPAKQYLAEIVMSVLRAHAGRYDVVAVALGSVLDQSLLEYNNAGKMWNEKRFMSTNTRYWWVLLLQEWTTVGREFL